MNNPPSSLLSARRRREKRFRFYCGFSVGFAALMLVLLIGSIVADGYHGFFRAEIRLPVNLSEAVIDPAATRDATTLRTANYTQLITDALKAKFPQATSRRDLRQLMTLTSSDAGYELRDKVVASPALIGTTQTVWLPLSDRGDMYAKGRITNTMPEYARKFSDMQIGWLEQLRSENALKLAFNTGFFTHGDSRNAEQAGFFGAMVGSLLMLVVCMGIVFPLGVLTAVYLEEFAPRNRFVDVIEVNINNLAAVPSIVFGLLGLAVYLALFGMPRSAPLVGGMTLALMVLPVIIITTRVSLKAIPDSIRDAARALGASPLQVVFHHVVPLALPGIMTGAILAMARAIGETAPLLMIGMVGFFADIPHGFTDPATVMPVQVYLWTNNPEPGFAEKASAAILVLLFLLVAMNSLAIYIRKRFECRW